MAETHALPHHCQATPRFLGPASDAHQYTAELPMCAQELRGTPWLKRMPCLIIGRHPQTPREVTVICKQISGTLLLGDIKQELRVRCHQPGHPLLSPAEFEALAGCSKGKNWKVWR